MNQIEKVMAIKDLTKRLEMLKKVCCLEGFGVDCDGGCAKCIDALDEANSILQKVDGLELIAGTLEQTVERPLSFSKRMAICRLFNHWYHSYPEHLKYDPEMFFISYLDKKGWLNIQKIMDQMTDSRILAILGSRLGKDLIADDKKEEKG